MPITTLDEILNYLEILPDDANAIAAITLIHPACEQYISSYCNRTFTETNYKLEKYSGKSHKIIQLKNYPIISVDRIAINTLDAITIKNTDRFSRSSVSVSPTGIRLLYNGVVNSTILFTTSTTITAVISAINAIGSNWTASLPSSDLGNYKSTELIPVYGLNTQDSFNYLRILDDSLDTFEVDLTTAQIYKLGGWPQGTNNIYVDYAAGYATADMPEGLKHAVKMFVQYIYRMVREENLIGIDEYFTGKFRTILSQIKIPRQVLIALDKYKRVLI